VIGHSLAGFTLPHIEAGLRVYLAALTPLERREINAAFAEGFGGVVHDTDGRTYWPDADTAAARMYPDCSRAQSDWAFPQLRRQARLEPIPAPFGPGYVVIATLQDAAVDPDWRSLGYAGAGSPGRASSSVSAMVSLWPASVARATSSAASEARARSMSWRPTGLSP